MLNWRRHPATKRQQRIYLKIAACHLANTLHFYLPICLTLLLWAPLPVNYWTVPASAAAVDLAVCREEGSIQPLIISETYKFAPLYNNIIPIDEIWNE